MSRCRPIVPVRDSLATRVCQFRGVRFISSRGSHQALNCACPKSQSTAEAMKCACPRCLCRPIVPVRDSLRLSARRVCVCQFRGVRFISSRGSHQALNCACPKLQSTADAKKCACPRCLDVVRLCLSAMSHVFRICACPRRLHQLKHFRDCQRFSKARDFFLT